MRLPVGGWSIPGCHARALGHADEKGPRAEQGDQAGAYLHAEVHGREDAQDSREFLSALYAACREHGCSKALIFVRDSRVLFKPEDHGLGGETRGFVSEMVSPSCRIALIGDTSELNHSHDYLELIARQQQLNVKSFRSLASAIAWLEAEALQAADAAPGSDALDPGRAPKLA